MIDAQYIIVIRTKDKFFKFFGLNIGLERYRELKKQVRRGVQKETPDFDKTQIYLG